MPWLPWSLCPLGLKVTLLHVGFTLALWSALAAPTEAAPTEAGRGDERASSTPSSSTRAGEGEEVCNQSLSSQRTAADLTPDEVRKLDDMLQVAPGVISATAADRLRAIVDRRWSSLSEEYLEIVRENDPQNDDIIEQVDQGFSYSVDIVDDGSCTVEDESQFLVQADCDFVKQLLRDTLTPVVNRMVQKWSIPPTLYPCYSFVKRYLAHERVNLRLHRDYSSFITANVLLTDPEHSGGLEVFPNIDPNALDENTHAEIREDNPNGVVVELSGLGSMALHKGSLWHSAHIPRESQSRRYTLIVWYSTTEQECDDQAEESQFLDEIMMSRWLKAWQTPSIESWPGPFA